MTGLSQEQPLDQSKKSPHESGHSMIEVLVVVAIALILGTGVVRFLSDSQDQNAKAMAKLSAGETNKMLLNLIKRDFSFQTKNQVLNQQKAIDITRRQYYNPSNPEATYSVRYETRCKDLPPNSSGFGKMLKSTYSISHQATFTKVPSKCLARLNCSRGQYAAVDIKILGSGDDIPRYVPTHFPGFSGSRG